VPVATQVEAQGDDIDLGAVAGKLWAKRWWIGLSVVVITIPFTVVAFLSEPVYRASVLLVDARGDGGSMGALGAALGQLGGLASIARINVTGATQVDEAMAVMRSREFTERFVAEQQLLPELLPDLWDESRKVWLTPTGDPPTLSQGYKAFDAIRSVTQAGRGGLVTVSVEWHDPDKAAAWANALVERLNAEMRERAITSTNLSVGYLEQELTGTSTIETRQAINRLIEGQINQRMLANVTQEYAFRVVDRALPPDPDDAVGPSKLTLIALGPIIGLIFGVFAVLVINIVSNRQGAAERF
jgi:uncharacterized protein involved in exopolysaccharide biosynthesis